MKFFKLSICVAFVMLCTFYISAKAPILMENNTHYFEPVCYADDSTDASNNMVMLTDAEYDLLCRVLCLEDGGESEWSQRCVCSCIYNRLISGLWGNTVNDVLYAKGQFEVMPNISKAVPSELTCEIVKDVFINGNVCLEPRIMFFRTDYYHRWARAEFNVGNVYFSSSWWYQ